MRVFNRFVQSSLTSEIGTAYRRHDERQRRDGYERKIGKVEYSSFTPLVWSTSGSVDPSAGTFLKRLAYLLSEKTEQPYSLTMGWQGVVVYRQKKRGGGRRRNFAVSAQCKVRLKMATAEPARGKPK